MIVGSPRFSVGRRPKVLTRRIWSLFFVCLLSLLLAANTAFACTTIIVGKAATADGSVLIAHNEELGDNSAQHLVVVPKKTHSPGDVFELYSGGSIPQPETTNAYIASKVFDKEHIPGDFTGGINEYQVAIFNNMAWTRDIPEETAWDVKEGGVIWTEFTQMVLERAKNAREAVELIGMLAEKYELSCDPGTMFGVADPNEGWWVEIARGGQWIAQRVPDDKATMRANTFRIGVVDLDDSENVLHSKNLISYAVKKGWYDPSSGEPFDFAKVYGQPSEREDPYNTLRHEMVQKMLDEKAPRITKEHLMDVLRTHYEGTEHDKTNGYEKSPHSIEGVRTICRVSTEVSAVAQLRRWLPAEIGGVMWWCMGTPCTGVYVPWYMGTKEIPPEFQTGTSNYTQSSAYWRFFDLTELVDWNYKDAIDKVRATWKGFEINAGLLQQDIEARALRLYITDREKALDLLTWYSSALARSAYMMAGELIEKIKTEVYAQ